MKQDEFDEIKELVVQMRAYIIFHDVLLGECVAWNKLKEMFNIGVSQADWEKDLKWLEEVRGKTTYNGLAELTKKKQLPKRAREKTVA